MTRQLFVRAKARRDVADAVVWYAAEAGAEIAAAFVTAFEASLAAITDRPDTGSPRWADLLGLPGLRSRAVEDYPWIVFYVAATDRVEVWRVLHARRDIPAVIADESAAR